MILLLLACGGDVSEGSALAKAGEPVDTQSMEQIEVKVLQQELQQTKKEIECISVFLADRRSAQKDEDWSQPGMVVYESEGCKPMYSVKVKLQAE